MSGEVPKRKKIALVSGGADGAYNTVFANSFTVRMNELGASVLWFMSLSDQYNGEPHDVGEVNIYNLINYEKIDAIVIMTLTIKHQDAVAAMVEQAKEHNIPIISLDTLIDGVYNFSLGYEEALYDLINHVIDEHGVTKLAYISGFKGNFASDTREEVFKRVMNERGFPLEDDSIGYGYFWSTPTREWVRTYYAKHKEMPQAFICANDSMAIGVCDELFEMGYKVPDDVIVTGIDGINEAMTYSPTITTVKLNTSNAGTLIAERILEIIDEKVERVGAEIVDGERLFRRSCGCSHEETDNFNNKVKHDLYGAVDEWNSFSNQIIHLVEISTGGFTFEETMGKMEMFLMEIWSRNSRLCLCDNFISNSKDTEDVYSSYDSYQQFGYSRNIGYAMEYDHAEKKVNILPDFKSADIFPDYDDYFEKYQNAMFFPLHFQDRAIGYLAIEYSTTYRNFYIFNVFATNISMVLENARIQSELRSVVTKLEDMYVRDSMTNLFNRRGFYQLAPKLYETCIKEKKEFMVISIDLDGLKPTNDIYGHKEGDNAITTTANALLATASENEILARFGGDEYVVAGICQHEKYAEEFIAKFKDFLDTYNKNSGKPYSIQASCGIYKLIPDGTYPIDEFIRTADELMYKQKVETKKRQIVRSSRR